MAGRISLKVEEEIAFAESEEKTARIKINQASKREAGSAVGRAGWGFTIERRGSRKVYVPTDDAKKWIPVLLQAGIDGKSGPDMARMLDDARKKC
jgi:hypothetical protein